MRAEACSRLNLNMHWMWNINWVKGTDLTLCGTTTDQILRKRKHGTREGNESVAESSPIMLFQKQQGKVFRINENSAELFAFPSISIVTMLTDKQVICTIDNYEFVRQPRDMEGLAHCYHEEADSGMIVQVAEAANMYSSILTRGQRLCFACMVGRVARFVSGVPGMVVLSRAM